VLAEKLNEEVKKIIYEELPAIIQQHPEVKHILWKMLCENFAPKKQTEDRFERLLREIRQEAEANNRKFEEYNRKFEKILKKLDENDRKFEKILAEIKSVHRRIDRTIGALGARWGFSSEYAFREAIKDVIEKLTNKKVTRYKGFDKDGFVFGWPDQIELDVVIQNGELWIMEIKSSVSKPEVYAFAKKVQFYEKEENKKATRRIIVSPMVDSRAKETADRLGIEIFTAPEDLKEIM